MRFLVCIAALFLSACGGNETLQKRSEVSYQDIQPAAGMTYGEFRQHEVLGAGDMMTAQKRFIMLDRDNNGSLSEQERGGY
jgi:hypothetical protein